MICVSLPVFFLVLGAVLGAPEQASSEHERERTASEHSPAVEKRSPHYDFGLGKRAYSYVSEYKRLPVYNFGLGKRSRPYSFGLGKRAADEDSMADEEFTEDIDPDTLADLLDQYDDAGYPVKRARPYSFGLGKRYAEPSMDDKRARLYEFGLGKRVPLYNFGLGKRAKSYSFGLGKRLNSKFNFGLGKRERDLHRFSFGLGKRSAGDIDDSEASDMEA